MIRLSYVVSTIVDALETQGARASAVMVVS